MFDWVKKISLAIVCLGVIFSGSSYADMRFAARIDNVSPEISILFYAEQRQKFYHSLLQKNWGDVAKKYMSWFDSQEKNTMQEFFELCHISETDWDSFLQANKDRFNILMIRSHHRMKKLGLVDKEIRLPIKRLIKEFDLAHIPIVISKKNKKSLAIRKYAFMVPANANHDWLNLNEKKASILHELMHVLHDDSYQHYCMRKMLKICRENKTITLAQATEINNKIRRLHEMRADIFGGLVAPKFALAAARRRKRKKEIENSPFHPANAERAKYLFKLHQEMKQAQTSIF